MDADDTGESTAIRTYRQIPVSFKQLNAAGYEYNSESSYLIQNVSSCLIQNVYCLSSIEGYLPRSNMSYLYDSEERLLYVMGMLLIGTNTF